MRLSVHGGVSGTAGLFVLLVSLAGCFGQSSRDGGETPQQAARRIVRDDGGALLGVEPPPLPAAESPGEKGPFVEPPLLERPARLYHVVVDCRARLDGAAVLLGKLAALQFMPVGYPAVDQAGQPDAACRWWLLAGKFARRSYAEGLARALRAAGFAATRVVSAPYRHDRFCPSSNPHPSLPAVGRVFAGMPGLAVPVLREPRSDAPGTGQQLADGTLLLVHRRGDDTPGGWLRVQAGSAQGFLPAGRVLQGHNVYPAPGGKWAVMGIALGCADACRWDYWLVDRKLQKRQLLGPAVDRLQHAFSPNGRWLAYSTPGRPLRLLELDRAGSGRQLGAGVSPSWSPAGDRLYFRRPGNKKWRDQVVFASPPRWQVQTLFDFRGRPFYPRGLSAYPPAVDVLSGGTRLYTMFYRLVKRDGGQGVNRWKVVLTPDGKLVSKKAEQLTE